MNYNNKMLVSLIAIPATVIVGVEVQAAEKADAETIAKAKKEAQIVSKRIADITETTTEDQLKSIRIAYNALSTLAKSYVNNNGVLVKAENNLIYQNRVVKVAREQARAFDLYMEGIKGRSTITELANARSYYNGLSIEAKWYVTTYTKLVHLETMWSNPDYQNLYNNYYPHYADQQPSGGIEVKPNTHDLLYIPDAVVTVGAKSDAMVMEYRNGEYAATVSASNVMNSPNSHLVLTASPNLEVALPMKDLKATNQVPISVGASLGYKSISIHFSQGTQPKTFSNFVEVKVPVDALDTKPNAAIFYKLPNGKLEPAIYQVRDGAFYIKSKVGGTFVAQLTKITTIRYTDTNSNANNQYIEELAKRSIISGARGTYFLPNQTITRGDLAIMVARAANLTSSSTSTFTDVRNTANANLIQALNETGIMRGTSDKYFSLYDTVTREEAAVIFARLFRYLGMDVATMKNEQHSSFIDIENLSYESRKSIALMEMLEIFDENSNHTFNPNEKLTRDQFAKILYKAMEAAELM